jgi:hypothetical protein
MKYRRAKFGIIELLKSGKRPFEIILLLGVSKTHVGYWRRKLGIAPFKGGRKTGFRTVNSISLESTERFHRKHGLSYSEIGKMVNRSRQAVHQLLQRHSKNC